MCTQNAVDLFFFFFLKSYSSLKFVEVEVLVCFKRFSLLRGLRRERVEGVKQV